MKIIIAALIVSCLWASGSDAEPRWTRVRSDHFVFVGNAPERQIRDVAAHLEEFREVLTRVLPARTLSTTIPTTVFVFQDDAALTPYKPLFDGKPVALAGFFSGWTDRNVMAINAAAEQTALRVVFHEYAHFLAQNTSGRLPPWANEGLAGFYETFEAPINGKTATIGLPNDEYITLLKTSRLLTLSELLAVDYTSPVYNEGNRRSLFYAESWALMHYLQLGNPARTVQLKEYLSRLHDGGESKETFAQVFRDPARLERELRDYIQKFAFPALRVDFAKKLTSTTLERAEPLDDVGSTTYLADLLARSGHVDEARSRLEKVLDSNPDAAQAAEALGTIELNAGHADRALPWLERAAHDRTNAAVQVLWGRAVIDRYEQTSIAGIDPGPALNAARLALANAAQLRPEDAETLATYGRAESLAGEDHAKALALLDRAVVLAPAQDEYRLMLAEELIHQRQFGRATGLLIPLSDTARRPEIRESAAHVLSWISARRDDAGREDSTDVAQRSAPLSGERTRFRIPRPDETRVIATLTSVECDRGRVLLHLETADESLQLLAPNLAAVEFVSNQSAGFRTLSCGPTGQDNRVFATYVESGADGRAGGIDGQAVAIEVLPDGYVDRE